MSRNREELMSYANAELMDELNSLFINYKIWVLTPENEAGNRLRDFHPKLEHQYLDDLMMRLLGELRKDAKPMRKY